jgi:hypothetical protein
VLTSTRAQRSVRVVHHAVEVITLTLDELEQMLF